MLDVAQALHRRNVDWFILGGGSNVLIGDGPWDGAVIVTARMDSWEALDDRLVCQAGLPSSKTAEIALDHAKTGLEFLYRLPGSIGGALAGNARYDDVSIADVLISVLAVHPAQGMKRYRADEIDVAYKRLGIVRDGWIIGELELAWRGGDPEAIRTRMEEIDRFRVDSHHFDLPSCGCIFKNDHKNNIQAGRLIDSLGLKGMTVGGAKVSEHHANFIVNTGNATARDVLALIEKIEGIVETRTGIRLDREVRLFGNFRD